MYYSFKIDSFPIINNFYTVTRNTVWQITDKYNILIFIKEGSCSISFIDDEFILNPGDIFFIPANHSYTRRSINNTLCTMTYIHFSFPREAEQLDLPDLVKEISDAKNILDNQILNGAPLLSSHSNIYIANKSSLDNYSKLFLQLDDIKLFSTRRQLTCGLQSSISLCSILTSLSQNTIEAVSSDVILKKPDKVPANLKKAILYIRNHYTEKITLDELASVCNVSKQQLIRYFKAAFNVTPITYITDYKISRAKELLYNQPQLIIKEISDELGFDNQHYFTKVFIKATGESPSDYRYRITHYVDSEKKRQEPI